MFILLAFAFLAGIITVLSPCILPILPALLAAGTAQGKWRPLGIILGLIISFSLFTLTLTALIHSTGLSPDALRYSAIALIFLFGLVMIFPKFSDWFARLTNLIGTLGQKIQPSQSQGFMGGFLFGVALGLVWTPCAGPILAAITTLVATRAVTFTAVLLTLSYSIGAGLPLFFVAYGSSKIINTSRLLARYTERIRQFFGIVMILFAITLFFKWDMLLEQKLLQFVPKGFVESNSKLEEELKKIRGESVRQGMAPDFVGITDWINSKPLSLKELRGKVVLVDFWTYSCINCLRTLPSLEKWDTLYRDKGLVIVGVHTPEFAFEKELANVTQAVHDLGIKYPVALDNNYATWNAYHNEYWPAHYLIDQEGNIRMVHFGEGAYMETENAIRSLLGLSPLMMVDMEKKRLPQTPETYLGLSRGKSYAPEIILKANQSFDYSYHPPLGYDTVGLKGAWRAEPESILSESDGSEIDLNFEAKQVYIVLGGKSETPLRVVLDGKPSREIKIDGDRKYDLVDTTYGRHLLSILVPSGIRAYVFTFGND